MKTLLFLALFALPLPALAQTADQNIHRAPGDQSPASLEFAEAHAKMHKGMAIQLTGNPDVDFVAAMIPHRQGAVDMARTVLKYGKDPDVRALAEAVIKTQEAEIAWMTEWLAAQPR